MKYVYKKKPDSEKDVTELLHPYVRKWFQSKFKEFSLPQKLGVMEIHSRNNVLVSAPTGATKTLTAFLSILNELVDSAEKGILEDKVYAVYISPLRALSNDIAKNLLEPLAEIEKIAGKSLGIRVSVRTGDTKPSEKQKMLKNPPHILITTPESLAIMLSSWKFKEKLSKVEWCIIDEIHALADNKRGVHLSLSLERLQRYSPGMCRIGLSATVAPLEEITNFLVGMGRECKIIDVQFIKQLDLKVVSPVDDMVNTSYEEVNKKLFHLLDKLIQEHKTTLVFTNTRAGTERIVHHLKTHFPNNYYKISEIPPHEKASLIGAHHGSLSRDHRFELEENLRNGKLKAVCCSTSLELGLDIGYIDLVVCIGSPKSVARFLQRAGRAGHKLHETVKARILVTDRDDLVECSVLLKNAVEKKIDRVHIPVGSLDVLAQQLLGFALEEVWDVRELFKVVKKSYCFKDLDWKDYDDLLSYLAGEFGALEDRHIYGRIWFDRDENKIGKRGRMTRVIYMTNIGTIPDRQGVIVKIGNRKIGTLDEGFLEKLKKGDRFVLGGNVYQFHFSRGMVAQVSTAAGRKPNVPSWYSESLPLSYDLAVTIQHFRYLMKEKFDKKVNKNIIIKFINDYLYLDKNAAEALYSYMKEQYDYVGLPNEKELYIENYTDENGRHYAIFHTLYGRRVNDALSRVMALAVSRAQHKDVEIGISDNGFYLGYEKGVNALSAFKLIKSKEFKQALTLSIDKSEILKRRFRHCAGRSLMILRNYMGRRKYVGRQQVSSMILMSAVRRIDENFPILKEARREVMEDVMDVDNATNIIKQIENKDIKIKDIQTLIPSPFAFNLVLQGYADVLKMEERKEFIKRMHKMVLAKISLKNGNRKRN